MRFKIKDIGEEGLEVDLPLTADWMAAALPDLDARPGPEGAAVRGRLQLTGDEVFLLGQMQAVVDTTCVRCLEPARVTVDEELRIAFMPRSEEDDDDASEDKDEEPDVDVAYYSDDEIDLGPEIHDQFLLSMPPNPLCSESCAGLCPVCGGNRNQNPCDCESKQRQAQSPLAELGKLKI